MDLIRAEEIYGDFLTELGLDWKEDPNMKDTPHRVAKMFINELFIGTHTDPPKITVFPNEKHYDEIIISGPISVKSMCAHHFMPFSGEAWIGYMPNDKIIGLSKFSRVVEWFARRPQIQEDLTSQVADYIEKLIQPKGIIVFIKSKHYCVVHRGVNEADSKMITSVARGVFREKTIKDEFFELVNQR